MKTWHYACIVFIGGCCYGILSTFVKLAYAAGFSTAEVTGGQFLSGTLLIWLVALFAKKGVIHSKQVVQLLLAGIPFGLTSVFYYQSLQSLSASLAIIFLFQFVWIGALFERIFLKIRPTRRKLMSIFIILVGSIFAANVLSAGGMSVSWQGVTWGLLSALTFTTFIFLSGSIGKDTPPVLKGALLSTGGLVVVCIVWPPMFLVDYPVLIGVMPYGLLLGLFGVLLPPLLFSIGMPRVGPGLGTILTASELPVAVSMSSLVLGEQVGFTQWFGVALILGGIVASNISLPSGKIKPAQSQQRSAS
ncbi:multidrug DMT transporter permease [Ammoniphilus oxalaticus]|uniref:Multidrug DMT transporter permease n=1 Tax=Ammoniphilus oxalaticus TaxID=66863 RepID=A0A419SNR6_9BACL|nr:DMT family transporter [Ammoniphilus oxalaticus]RKD25907.1 multidrug DMT transporter permease [Ammoniphilus oxalaticus]